MEFVQKLDPTSTLTTKFVEVPVPAETNPSKANQAPIHLTQSNSDAVLHIKKITLEINNSISPEQLGLLVEAIMLNSAKGLSKVYLAYGYTDLSLGIDGLSYLIQDQFQLNSFTPHIFFMFYDIFYDTK